MQWETLREGHIPVTHHEQLAALLRAAYPHFPGHFAGRRSWSYLRPELRVTGWSDRTPLATAGVLRRFISVGGTDQLVAIVGLVAVHPDEQGHGTGLALMAQVEKALRELAVPFGVLMCAPRHAPFYRRAGWHQLTPRRVRFLTDDTTEPDAVVDEIVRELFVLPVDALAADWAAGTVEWHCASV